jgi:superfamily II DNA/RNA helicase
MIAELAVKVWDNPKFHEAAQRAEMAWLQRELGVEGDVTIGFDDAKKLARAAAILACSTQQPHRDAAFRTATSIYDLVSSKELPLDQALRVVLARLGNFPSFATRADVNAAQSALPMSLVAEELNEASAREIVINEEKLYFTNFQHDLWTKLSSNSRVALSAPTSAGKSFVLQNYLVALFSKGKPTAVVYIVPTRALITQVARDLALFFRKTHSALPDIVTVPIDGETPLATRTIYVMTQERVQLALASHSDFLADVIVVDEAQSIADGSRGVLLQWILDDLLKRSPQAQVLFASPNIRNLGVFGRLFGLKNIREITSTEPTVAQNFLVVKINSATKGNITICKAIPGVEEQTEIARFEIGHTIASRVEKLVHIAARLGRNHANIVYANGAADAEKIAIQLSDLFSSREPTPERLALSELAREVVHPNYVLVDCIKRGVAFHYSNIPTQLRRAIEDAVSNGHVDYLVCTSTLLQGVNLPVRNIFMCLPERGKSHPLESTDFWNLSGRAGRLRREFQGNIFLIHYAHWKVKPLDGPREAIIVPAIEATIRDRQEQLVSVITNRSKGTRLGDDAALETAFVRLYSDHKRGALLETLVKAGITSRTVRNALSVALRLADTQITLPSEIIRLSPNISAHKQQLLFNRLQAGTANGRQAAEALIPHHPRESDAYSSYSRILEQCYELILGRDASRGLHRFHALMALKWVRGLPLPQIIDERIKRDAKRKDSRAIIRDTLELIETQIRFQAVRMFGCYNTILVHALKTANFLDLADSIPSLPLYLELGASDKTMISFIALGLSRVTAMKLNELSARKDLDVTGALQWLRTRPLDQLGLSPLLLAEIRDIIDAS